VRDGEREVLEIVNARAADADFVVCGRFAHRG
jgi:hypothetical protein